MNKELYEKIRKNAQYDVVIKNIYRFAAICNKKNRPLGLSITPMTLNWKEIPELVHFANSLKANIYFSFVEKPEKYALWSLGKKELQRIADYYKSVILPVKTPMERSNKRCFEEIILQIEFWIKHEKAPYNADIETGLTNIYSEKEAFIQLKENLITFFNASNRNENQAKEKADKVVSKIHVAFSLEKDDVIRHKLWNKILCIEITDGIIEEINNTNPQSLYEKALYFLSENYSSD